MSAPEQRLTIGYLSADFHRHPTAYLSAGLFEAHDRSRFRILAYANGPDDGSAMRQRLVKAFDEFIDLKGMSPSEAAARMRADGVDLLVDLKGHTLDAAPEILALRPAPVQIHYLGYPGTLGAPWIDYLIGDAWVTPPEHADSYQETLVRLPDSYQINDRQRPLPAASGSREDHGLPRDGIVLCCFNNAWKFNQDTLDCWLHILRAAPETVLWLLGREGSHLAAKSLRSYVQAAGIAPERLIFSKSRPLEAYLALYHHADLFLDSWPYNAHTTASDALWMGCPVLSWPGTTFASRVGASLLAACEMPELICRDRAHYRERALDLIAAPEQLRQYREQLIQSRGQLPLFDTQATTRALEAAYEEMARQYRAGRRDAFDVPPARAR
ncbi:MAG: UDP-N-acetylglucosamine-peptide N-acetylglucosaminyltransferase [Xanthomonadales bacterium]|nr:UDP-N-acetylglucosamine-peptide N-acetylglucosaminyltransferase [Xanthomonadales bacterium]